MYEQVEKPKENKSRAIANSVTWKKNSEKQSFTFVDNRPDAVTQRVIRNMKSGPVAKQEIAGNRTEIIQREWTAAEVNLVLDKDDAGRDTITSLNNQGYDVIRFSGGTFHRQYFQDAERTIRDGKPEEKSVNGWHNRGEKLIAINNNRDKNGAASTLVHEVAHANQHKENESVEGEGRYPDTKAKEYDAHIKQDHFNKAAGIDPKEGILRNEDGSVNEDNIKTYVNQVYAVGAQARYYTNTPKVYDTLETIKPWPAI